MAIGSWDQVMYAWNNNTEEVVVLENTQSSTYYNGNFKGAHRIPVTISSNRLTKGSGTTTYDLSSHIKNDGTYIRFEIKGSGYTTSLTAGDVYLIFEDPDDPLLELTLTIQEAVDEGLIDPIAFRYTSMSSTSYTWDTSNLFTGGRTNSKSYPYAYLFVRPYEEYTLKKIRFYTSKSLNTTYDGFIISQTNISMVSDTEGGVFPAYYSEGTYTANAVSIEDFRNAKLMATVDEPDDTSISFYYSIVASDLLYGSWTSITNGDEIVLPEDKTGQYLWIKAVLETSDVSVTPSISELWIEETTADDQAIAINLTPTGRMKHPQGEVTLVFSGSLSGAMDAQVASFSASFTPTGVIPWFNPNDLEKLELSDIEVIANSVAVYYSSAEPFEEFLEFANVVASGVITHVDDIAT